MRPKIKFTVMHELRYYLEMLLHHECVSGNGDCRECQSLQRIYRFMQNELFASVIYTETLPAPRQPAQPRPQPVNRAVAGPRPPHAA